MATERTRNAVILGTVILVVALVLGGLTFLAFKIRAQAAQRRALEKLKATKPVEYYIQHTPLTQTGDDLRNAMLGTWELRGVMNRQIGQFIFLPAKSGYFKTWTPTNWSIVTYGLLSNVQYTASGHYTLQGDNYTESIEAATGQMTQYLGAHPAFRIRVDGDTYYQMSAGRNSNPLEEMWQRVQ
jgi:hypothetical protein